MAHRLRATPHLARNMALIANAVQFWAGFTIMVRSEYLKGVDKEGEGADQDTGDIQTGVEVKWDSGQGQLMAAYCFLTGERHCRQPAASRQSPH